MQGDLASLGSGDSDIAFADCPDGEILTGGGFNIGNGVHVEFNGPGVGERWQLFRKCSSYLRLWRDYRCLCNVHGHTIINPNPSPYAHSLFCFIFLFAAVSY